MNWKAILEVLADIEVFMLRLVCFILLALALLNIVIAEAAKLFA